MGKRHGSKGNSQKRKKQKTAQETEQSDVIKAEVLDIKTIREGMLLLGCVFEIRSNCFLMSLPGCLVGKVPLAHISNKYSEIIRSEEEDDEEEIEADLHSIVQLGAVYPCKVLNVSHEEGKKPSIILSINPQDVNAELRLSSLFLKMVLHAAVQSIEDHGYVLDIGIKGAQGFLPFSASSGQKNLIPGQIIPTSVRKLPSQKGGNVVWLSELSFNDQFPEVEDDSLKLTSLLPGTNITTYITEIKSSFLYGKCMDFDACANAMSLGNLNISEACKTSGTILYIHPVTHMIYLLFGPKPTPKTFKNFFKVKKFDLLKNVKYQHTWHHRLFFKAHHGTTGFVKQIEIEKTSISADALVKDPIVPMARVVFLHYMDKLVHLSFNKKMLESEIVRLEDVQIGDIYKATVKKHIASGMFLTVSVGLSGFVRQIHISDAFVTMPEKLHPVGSEVKCRVLSLHHASGLTLTCKESLLNLPKEGVLKSYEQAHPGQMYKGVIVHKTDDYILVLFFNDVKGVVPSDQIPESSVFFIGQTVSCHIIQSRPDKQKLRLSLLGDKHFTQNSTNTTRSQASSTKPKTKKMLDLETGQLDPKKTHKAVIKSITGHQLNLVLGGGLIGRVHITELGCSEEDFMPLKQFTAGTNLKVHIIGSNTRRSVNYLAITHQNFKHFCECSFEYPPPVALQKEFFSGMSIMGFVKEAGDTSASIWLSPTQIGTLDYLHFSDNPKVLRKLKKQLKVGLSLSVSILDVEKSKGKGATSKITLTKIEKRQMKVGLNTIGLVQVASPEKGLILKLPHGYHGVVCLTDLQDVFTPAKAELEKCRKLSFILCHILEVNHNTKFCHLSLRKSRVYNLNESTLKGIQPELTTADLEQGKKVKGFLKSVSDKHIIVNFGRMLDGKVSLHKCTTYGCSLCKYTQNILKKYSIGYVLDVVIQSVTAAKGLYSLSLPELSGLGVNQQSRLSITKDVDWNEL